MLDIQDAPLPVTPALTARAGLPEAICDVAAAVLPPGSRDHYLELWRADREADPSRSLRYSLRVLAGALPLRWTLTGHLHPDRPLRCQAQFHRFVLVHDNRENLRFVSRQCVRCGLIKDNWRSGGDNLSQSCSWTLSRGG